MAYLTEEIEKRAVKAIVNRVADEYGSTVDSLVFDSDGCFSVQMTFVPHIDNQDDFSSVFPEILKRKLFTPEAIEEYLYESGKDWEWYGDGEPYFPYDTLRHRLLLAFHPKYTEDDWDEIFNEFDSGRTIVMTEVAERIYSDLQDWISQKSHKVLTLTDLKPHDDLREYLGSFGFSDLYFDFYTDVNDSDLTNWIKNERRVDLVMNYPLSEYAKTLIRLASRKYSFDTEDVDEIEEYVRYFLDEVCADEFDYLWIKDKDMFCDMHDIGMVWYLESGGIVALSARIF